MARRARPSYWPSRGTWQNENGETKHGAYCCHYKGKQIILAEGPDDMRQDGPTWKAAHKKFYELTILGNAENAKDHNTVQVVAEHFLRHISTRRSKRTYKIRKNFLQAFVSALGRTTIHSLTRFMVDSWLDSMRQWRKHPATGHPTRWTDGSVRNAVASIQTCPDWAAASGLISKNSLGALPAPHARSKGRFALIGATPEERSRNHQRILAAASKPFTPFIICLEATGCRRGELVHVTAADFNAELGAIVYHADSNRLEREHSHKTASHGKDRTIFLSGEALEIVKELAKKYRKGPLFRTKGKRGWTDSGVVRRFKAIREATGIPRLTAYSYRHTFATAWLEKGKSIDILAELRQEQLAPALVAG